MYLALAAYENRIASLLETANRFVVIDLPPNDFISKKIVVVMDNTLSNVIQLLHKNNITVLICGAINSCMFWAIEAAGIQVIPWITGDVDDVLEAYKNDTLEKCMMPGCFKGFRRGRRWRRGWDAYNAK